MTKVQILFFVMTVVFAVLAWYTYEESNTVGHGFVFLTMVIAAVVAFGGFCLVM